VCVFVYIYVYMRIHINVYSYMYIIYIYIYIYMYIIYIYMYIFFGSGGRAASCMMARAKATYVLNHFSRRVSSSCAGSVFSIQVDHVVTVLKSCVMSFLSIASSATLAPHITCCPT
jgi:hypothetical protein